MKIKRDNHFVPRMYLKSWSTDGQVEVYRTLVQHENVPLWKSFYLNGIGYLKNLYVNTKDGVECDILEVWFDQEYEAPAEKSIAKVIANEKLNPTDYKNLINFFALQDLRTPKKFVENINKDNSEEFETSLRKVVDKVMEKGVSKDFEPSNEYKFHDELPLKINISKKENGLMVNVEKLVGRASWLWSIKHLLSNVSNHLHKHKWTILHPAKGKSWLTSDNPALKLNHYGADGYDFKGGWANKGTELILPLGPQHLLYTCIGNIPPLARGTRVSPEKTDELNRLMAENSHRYIIADKKYPTIDKLHNRVVSPEDVRNELTQWKMLHEHHAESERQFYSERHA